MFSVRFYKNLVYYGWVFNPTETMERFHAPTDYSEDDRIPQCVIWNALRRGAADPAATVPVVSSPRALPSPGPGLAIGEGKGGGHRAGDPRRHRISSGGAAPWRRGCGPPPRRPSAPGPSSPTPGRTTPLSPSLHLTRVDPRWSGGRRKAAGSLSSGCGTRTSDPHEGGRGCPWTAP